MEQLLFHEYGLYPIHATGANGSNQEKDEEGYDDMYTRGKTSTHIKITFLIFTAGGRRVKYGIGMYLI